MESVRRSKRVLKGSTSTDPACSEDASYEPIAEHENSEAESEKVPPVKKRKVTKKATEGQPTAKKVRRIQGKLKHLKEMPIDILFEIFSQLDPIDLVNISRTSKALHAILLSRSSISVWKAARANIVPALPDCPEDLSEPQYAELIFGKCCHYCQRKLGTIHVSWIARRRICNKCLGDYCRVHLNGLMANMYSLEKHVPKLEAIRVPGRRTSYNYYFTEFVDLWREGYEHSDEKEAWKTAKIKEREVIENHAGLCKAWVKTCCEIKEAQLDELIEKRRSLIADRVIFLGWGDEVQKMSSYERKFEDSREITKLCHKELTEQIITALDDEINTFMKSLQEARLASERRAFLGDRLPILQKVYNKYIRNFSIRDQSWYPMAGELYHETEVRNIVNDQSSTLESMKEELELAIPKVFPDLVTQLRRRIDDQLLEHIAAQNPEQQIDHETVFNLATTIFECPCRYGAKRILRYDEVLFHSCTRKYEYPGDTPDRSALSIYLPAGTRSHKTGITMSKVGMKLIPILIKLCGLDPSTTTAQTMDDLNPIFECVMCGSAAVGRATMTWLGAVSHFNEYIHSSRMNEEMQLERLNGEEEDAARKRITENQERARATRSHDTKFSLQCVHCKPKREIDTEEILSHLKEEHKIMNPTVEMDIMCAPDVNHVPPVFYMWPPRKPRQPKA